MGEAKGPGMVDGRAIKQLLPKHASREQHSLVAIAIARYISRREDRDNVCFDTRVLGDLIETILQID